MLIALTIFAASGEPEILLPIPPIFYGLIALAVFVASSFVVWSFRDVANRHSEKAEQFARENEDKAH